MPRFIMFIQPNATDEQWEPSPAAVERMAQFNEELTRAGLLLALDGLHPLSRGARLRFSGGTATVLDSPFEQPTEVVGGYWIIQARTLDEAVEWARRVPAGEGDQIEVRRVYEMSDFPQDVQQAAGELSSAPPQQTEASL